MTTIPEVDTRELSLPKFGIVIASQLSRHIFERCCEAYIPGWRLVPFIMRMWRTIKVASLALLIIGGSVLANTVRYRYDQNHLMRTMTAQSNELQQTKLQLQETTHLLANAENKLVFLNQNKTAVQVTAFTGRGSFASGRKTAQSYAVPHHTLPEDKVLNIALSPTARRELHARMNDYIVLLDKDDQKARLARFVDTTSANEVRPVVDVYFAKKEEAITFGRQDYLAVNISAEDSPFTTENDAP